MRDDLRRKAVTLVADGVVSHPCLVASKRLLRS
jgi:hypothetical protein